MNESIPITIIGGYLGAGKTTLVNHLLRHADGARLAVLVNEFGSLPIDQDLIVAQDENMISISGGCVCCSYGNDMVLALDDLARLDPLPDLVLLEASGVALPGGIRATAGLMAAYAPASVVVLADAETVRQRADDPYMGDTVRHQLTDADLLVLNKADLVSPERLAATDDWLREFAPDAALIHTSHAALPLSVIGGLSAIASEEPHHHHAEADFVTASFAMAYPVDAESLARSLAAAELGLLRAKGFVHDLSGALTEIQTVGRRRDVRPAPAGAAPGLVCIGFKGQADMASVAELLSGPAAPVPSLERLSPSAL